MLILHPLLLAMLRTRSIAEQRHVARILDPRGHIYINVSSFIEKDFASLRVTWMPQCVQRTVLDFTHKWSELDRELAELRTCGGRLPCRSRCFAHVHLSTHSFFSVSGGLFQLFWSNIFGSTDPSLLHFQAVSASSPPDNMSSLPSFV